MSVVIGGDNGDGNPEIIEIPNENFFTSLPVFRDQNLQGAFGLSNGDRILICGLSASLTECHQLIRSAKWQKARFSMVHGRSHAATVPIDEESLQWLVTGGERPTQDEGIVPLESSEIFAFNIGSFSEGPALPEPVSMHCMVKVDPVQISTTGGRDVDSKAVSTMNMLGTNDMALWTSMPGMEKARYGHSCGSYGGVDIIVVGGLGIEGSEIFSMILGQWYKYSVSLDWDYIHKAYHLLQDIRSFPGIPSFSLLCDPRPVDFLHDWRFRDDGNDANPKDHQFQWQIEGLFGCRLNGQAQGRTRDDTAGIPRRGVHVQTW